MQYLIQGTTARAPVQTGCPELPQSSVGVGVGRVPAERAGAGMHTPPVSERPSMHGHPDLTPSDITWGVPARRNKLHVNTYLPQQKNPHAWCTVMAKYSNTKT